MVSRKSLWVLLGVFSIATCLLGIGTQIMAESWNAKFFYRGTKSEGLWIPDASEHWVGMIERDGVILFENGELAWSKRIAILDGTKGMGPMSEYTMTTFQDGSTITTHAQGSIEGLNAGKYASEIIYGTGRFRGIKGTVTSSGKILPREKGEIIEKIAGESTMIFTLPSK